MVADASYRQRINIPLDCRDGACGTCKSFCESGSYDGGDYIEDALTDEEADEGYVLTCQMVPESDLILRIPATSDVAKTSIATYSGEVASIEPGVRHRDRVRRSSWTNPSALGFLPGQYVNIQVPGTDQTRSFSFSSGPGRDEVGVPRPQHHARRAHHVPARPGQARRQDRVQRPARQLLPARAQAAPRCSSRAAPGWRRSCRC